MPSPMVHLYAAQMLEPDAPKAYFLGNIAPDYIGDRKLKDHAHFRDVDNRLEALARFGSRLDPHNSFERGWLFHLFVDAFWDEEEIPRYKIHQLERGNEDTWFAEYRNEITLLSCHMYHRLELGPVMLEKIKNPDDVSTSLNVDGARIEWYREFVVEKHETSEPGLVPHFYSLDQVEEFSHLTVDEYIRWNKDWR